MGRRKRGSPLPPAPLGSSGGGWRLTFQDEFEGTQLDPAKWSNGWGWSGDAAFEAGHCDPANNVVANGVLVQRVQNLPQAGMPFSAACINTRDKFSQLYGYWEARMQIPSGQRLHSAFWAKPNTGWWPPELDVEETRVPEMVTMTVHWEEAGVHVKHNDKFNLGPTSLPATTCSVPNGPRRRPSGSSTASSDSGPPTAPSRWGLRAAG